MENDGTCALCTRPGSSCTFCFKVSYCGVEHQMTHRPTHKADCFPAEVKEGASGKYMVATRTIQQGSSFMREIAMIYGPSGLSYGTDSFIKICLSCYRPVITDYVCSKCRWPVCSKWCEKKAPHVKFECPIFAANQVPPITNRIDYEFISILRCLILRGTNPNRYERLRGLNFCPDQRYLENASITNSIGDGTSEHRVPTRVDQIVHFIRNVCKMVEYDYYAIDYIQCRIGVNAFGENAIPFSESAICNIRWGSYMFEKSSFISHDCVPNLRWFIHEKWTADLRPTYTIYFKATKTIRFGEVLSMSYTDLTQGTFERRLDLYEGYFFSCKCNRCLDPKELGTFFSGIKCTGCYPGYIVPYSGAGCRSMWRCHEGCGGFLTAVEANSLVESIRLEYDTIDRSNKRDILERLDEFIHKHSKRIVHRNHFIMMEAELELTKRLAPAIANMLDDDIRTIWINRLVELTQHAWDVFSVLSPGKSLDRGYYYFYFAQAQYYKMINEFTLLGVCNDAVSVQWSVTVAQDLEAREIMIQEPEGSEAFLLAKSSTLHEKLQALKRLFEERGIHVH